MTQRSPRVGRPPWRGPDTGTNRREPSRSDTGTLLDRIPPVIELTVEQRHAAALTVCDHAVDADDAVELLTALGLK